MILFCSLASRNITLWWHFEEILQRIQGDFGLFIHNFRAILHATTHILIYDRSVDSSWEYLSGTDLYWKGLWADADKSDQHSYQSHRANSYSSALGNICPFGNVAWWRNLWSTIHYECHSKINMFEVRKIGKILVFKIVQNLFNSKYSHTPGIKITRNSSIFHEITPLFDIPDSIPTLVGYVQPCFEPRTGRFSHNTHHMTLLLNCSE